MISVMREKGIRLSGREDGGWIGADEDGMKRHKSYDD